MRGIGASLKIWEIMDREPRVVVEGEFSYAKPIYQFASWALIVGRIPSHPLRPSLRLDKVGFSYGSRKEVEVLRNLSLEIPEGSFTAFVGARLGCLN